MSSIGQLNETDLHQQLKHHYAGEEGRIETDVDGFVVDVVLADELVEIQTRGLGRLRKKITRLCEHHTIRIVHPVAVETRLVTLDTAGTVLRSRRSPRRGRVESVFRELTSLADLLPHPHIHLDVVLVTAVEHRVADGKGSWRRRGVTVLSRALGEVRRTVCLYTAADYLALLPPDLPHQFTNGDLAEAAALPYSLAQPLTSTLRKMGLIRLAGKRGRELLYLVSEEPGNHGPRPIRTGPRN